MTFLYIVLVLALYCIISTGVLTYFSFRPIRCPFLKKVTGICFFPGWWMVSKLIELTSRWK